MAVSGYKGLVQLLEKNSSDKIANKKEYFFKVTGDHATYFSILPPYTRKTFEALVKNNDFIINTNPDVQSTVSKAQQHIEELKAHIDKLLEKKKCKSS